MTVAREKGGESWGSPGKPPGPICGRREGFPEEGSFYCKLRDVSVRQGKEVARDKNPYRVNNKTKAERGEETTEFAVSRPSSIRRGSIPGHTLGGVIFPP